MELVCTNAPQLSQASKSYHQQGLNFILTIPLFILNLTPAYSFWQKQLHIISRNTHIHMQLANAIGRINKLLFQNVFHHKLERSSSNHTTALVVRFNLLNISCKIQKYCKIWQCTLKQLISTRCWKLSLYVQGALRTVFFTLTQHLRRSKTLGGFFMIFFLLCLWSQVQLG